MSVVSSKPLEDQPLHDGQNYDANYALLRPRRQLPDEVTLNKQFFENIFKASRISRDTSDGEAVPTIALHDLISSVEHTLIHSAQNLAASNITANLTTPTNAESDSSNISHIQHIVLPINVPTPEPPKTEDITTESEDIDSATEKELIRDNRSNAESDAGKKEGEFESIKPVENSSLGILFPVSLNSSANISQDPAEDVPVTEETIHADPANITIIHTINSTQVIPTSESDVVHVHQQQITFFSANAGVFPNIHAVKAEDLPSILTKAEDCSGEEISDESTEAASSSDENSSSDSSSEEGSEKTKKTGCTPKTSVASAKPIESTTPSVEAVKKLKTEELQEKIAEVEADPVILTQGI